MRGDDQSILRRIDEEFRTLVIDIIPLELSFDGRTAEIVDDRQEGIFDSGSNTFTLHRICRFARNTYGEYFYFVSDGSGRPYLKHVPHSNAKIALGSKYLAPPLKLMSAQEIFQQRQHQLQMGTGEFGAKLIQLCTTVSDRPQSAIQWK